MRTIATSKKNDLDIDTPALQKVRLVLKSIDHALRLSTCKLIHRSNRMIVTNIYRKLKLEQSVASQHLKWLRMARVVRTERDGKRIYYSLDYERLTELNLITVAFLS
jgi:DNA-binding transcriptional ArsR family regulator